MIGHPSPVIGEIDVTVVATRRPMLLDLTLRSFRMNLLRHLSVRRLIVNIDPVWGDEADGEAVKALCRLYFNNVLVRAPDTPSFGAAVQWTWSQTECDWFLHLEDDWCLRRRINLQRLAAEMRDPDVAQVSFGSPKKKLKRGVWTYITMQPGMMRGSVGRIAAARMNPELDPEKQFYNGMNPALNAAVATLKARVHGSRFEPACVADTGREWRKVRDIRKSVRNGVAQWTGQGAGIPVAEERSMLDDHEARLSLSRFLPRI